MATPRLRASSRTTKNHQAAPPAADRASAPAWDLMAAAGAMAVAAVVSRTAASESLAWFSLAVLAVVPGYLLMQAIRPRPRLFHVLVGLGFSIPIVALLALATSVVPGGFQAGPIVATVTVGVLGLAAVAWVRRRAGQRTGGQRAPSTQRGPNVR